jgi:hypothetical protein
MIITLKNLQKGLERYKQMWPKDVDVRNTLYKDIYDAKKHGVTNDWWEATVERLSKWRATRCQGCTKVLIRKRGREQLNQISQQYDRLSAAEEPCITDLEWTDLEELFNIASMIKLSKSPMFASKMCHFLFPKLFIVIDGKATGLGHYELYWRGLKDAWTKFEQKEEAKVILLKAINNTQNLPLHPNYPVETTIMEMCVIGYNNRPNNV